MMHPMASRLFTKHEFADRSPLSADTGLMFPMVLFGNPLSPDVGVAYDITDMASIFQDVLGTVPAAVNTQVKLMKDKSRAHPNAITLGAELVTNGGFSADANWTKGTGWTIAGGKAVATAVAGSASISQAIALTIHQPYLVEFDVVVNSGSVSVGLGTSGLNDTFSGNLSGPVITVSGHYARMGSRPTTDTNLLVFFRGEPTFDGTIDNVSVKAINNLDNHAFQPDSLYAGFLRGTPTGPNLLTNSAFATDLSGWTDTSISGGIINWSPLEGGCVILSAHGADTVGIGQAIATDIGQLYQVDYDNLGPIESLVIGIKETNNAGTQIAFADRPRLWFTATTTTTWINLAASQNAWRAIKNVRVRKADAANVGAPYLLALNGAAGAAPRSYMVTLPIDFSVTDKITTALGVKEISSGAFANLCTSYTIDGSFLLYTGGSQTGGFLWVTKGTGGGANGQWRSAPAHPKRPEFHVVSCVHDIAGVSAATEEMPRLNGYVPTLTDVFGPAGTGNFANDNLFLFTLQKSSFVTGDFARAVVIGRTLAAGDILSAEGWAFDGLQLSYLPSILSNGGGASAAVSVYENYSYVTTVEALGRGVMTFDIAGGADAAKFQVSAGGVVSFIAAPNFEAPTDANTDNVYQVTVRATNSHGSGTQALSVTVLDTAIETAADIVALMTGNPGAFYDPGALNSFWADTAGTVPAVVGGLVARWDDKSGNGYHLVQATTSKQGILRQLGSYYRIEGDGIDDAMGCAITFSSANVHDSEVIVAAKYTGASGGVPCALVRDSLTTGVAALVQFGASGIPNCFFRDDAGVAVQQGEDTAYLNTDVVFGARYKSSINVIETNGRERIHSGSNGGNVGPERGVLLGTTQVDRICVLANGSFGGGFVSLFQGLVGGLVLRSPAFTAAQRAGISSYLKAAAGVAP